MDNIKSYLKEYFSTLRSSQEGDKKPKAIKGSYSTIADIYYNEFMKLNKSVKNTALYIEMDLGLKKDTIEYGTLRIAFLRKEKEMKKEKKALPPGMDLKTGTSKKETPKRNKFDIPEETDLPSNDTDTLFVKE